MWFYMLSSFSLLISDSLFLSCSKLLLLSHFLFFPFRFPYISDSLLEDPLQQIWACLSLLVGTRTLKTLSSVWVYSQIAGIRMRQCQTWEPGGGKGKQCTVGRPLNRCEKWRTLGNKQEERLGWDGSAQPGLDSKPWLGTFFPHWMPSSCICGLSDLLLAFPT